MPCAFRKKRLQITPKHKLIKHLNKIRARKITRASDRCLTSQRLLIKDQGHNRRVRELCFVWTRGRVALAQGTAKSLARALQHTRQSQASLSSESKFPGNTVSRFERGQLFLLPSVSDARSGARVMVVSMMQNAPTPFPLNSWNALRIFVMLEGLLSTYGSHTFCSRNKCSATIFSGMISALEGHFPPSDNR